MVGICGGYQMLGHSIHDPEHVESTLSEVSGMGLLPVQTVFASQKTTHQSAARLLGGPGWMRQLQGQTIQGYEIHMGLTTGTQPWLEITQRSTQAVQVLDGSSDARGQIWGCYIHGLFANASLRHAWLTALGWRGPQAARRPPRVACIRPWSVLPIRWKPVLTWPNWRALYGAVDFHSRRSP